MTNYPHLVVSDEERAHARAARPEDAVGARALDRVRQIFCGLRGHDNLLQFETDRMFLRCASCGHETPGWELTETRPAVAVREEARPALVRGHLVSARRIA